MFPEPLRTPCERCHHNREEIFICNRPLSLTRKPSTTALVSRPRSPRSRQHRRRPLNLWESTFRIRSKLTPCQIVSNSCHQCKSKWNSRYRRIRWSLLRKQQRRFIIPAPQEGAFWPHNSSSTVKMADERFQLLPRTPSLTKLGVDETLQGCQFVCRKASCLLLQIQVDTQN